MNSPLSRRRFLERSALLGAGLMTTGLLPRLRATESAANKIRVGVMGLARGIRMIDNCLVLPGLEVASVCDPDQRRLDEGLAIIKAKQKAAVKGVQDFRQVLDDPAVDAVVIATTHSWLTPMTIMACAAGKHVYVEKPGSQTAHEAELIVAAARKHRRVVQMGNQRRSVPWIMEGIARVHAGEIGPVRFARCFSSNTRQGIGIGREVPVPTWLNYDLWQGPTPELPYKDNYLHHHWHFRWHWGGGELAVTGVHLLDLARWGLGVDYPRRTTCGGGHYYFSDDQETPDNAVVTYDFGDKGASYDWNANNSRKAEAMPLANFYGDKGSLGIWGNGYKMFDPDGRELANVPGVVSDLPHFENFMETIRGNAKPNSEIAVGQKSAMLCHLGNIAYRSGSTIDFDPQTRRIIGNPEAERKYWSREYRAGWEPKV